MQKSAHTLSPSFLFGKLRPSSRVIITGPPHARNSPATTPPSTTERLCHFPVGPSLCLTPCADGPVDPAQLRNLPRARRLQQQPPFCASSPANSTRGRFSSFMSAPNRRRPRGGEDSSPPPRCVPPQPLASLRDPRAIPQHPTPNMPSAPASVKNVPLLRHAVKRR